MSEVTGYLDDLEGALSDPKGGLEDAGQDLLETLAGNVQGGQYAPLAESTRRRKRALGQPDRPLIATGGLLDSLTRGGADNVLTTTNDTVEAGTGKPYAAFVAEGTSKSPARDFADLTDADVDTAIDAFTDWLLGE